MKPFWNEEIITMIRSIDFWKPKFENHLSHFSIGEMDCFIRRGLIGLAVVIPMH